MFARRTRTVSFRLLEAEYHHLQKVCAAHGVRSLSDFARGAVLRLIAESAATGEIAESIESRLDRLDVHVKMLERELGRLLGREGA